MLRDGDVTGERDCQDDIEGCRDERRVWRMVMWRDVGIDVIADGFT